MVFWNCTTIHLFQIYTCFRNYHSEHVDRLIIIEPHILFVIFFVIYCTLFNILSFWSSENYVCTLPTIKKIQPRKKKIGVVYENKRFSNNRNNTRIRIYYTSNMHYLLSFYHTTTLLILTCNLIKGNQGYHIKIHIVNYHANFHHIVRSKNNEKKDLK